MEEVLGKDEIVIKNLGDYLRRVKLFPGTTIAPDGSLILLIDLNRMVSADTAERHALPSSSPAARVFAPGAEAVAAGSIPAEAVDAVANDRVVVVADDSISVRKFVGRMLEKAGYRVKLASDGLEASEIVAQVGCHLIITDLEMPRMNGYELIAHLRQSPSHAPDSGAGGYIARRSQASRTRLERRGGGIPHEAGTGRSVDCHGEEPDGSSRRAPERACAGAAELK